MRRLHWRTILGRYSTRPSDGPAPNIKYTRPQTDLSFNVRQGPLSGTNLPFEITECEAQTLVVLRAALNYRSLPECGSVFPAIV